MNKKSEALGNMGHVGQTDDYNRAGVQGNRPKRKGARSIQNGFVKAILLGGGRTACMGDEKKKRNMRN
jgi:hypothetical protein